MRHVSLPKPTAYGPTTKIGQGIAVRIRTVPSPIGRFGLVALALAAIGLYGVTAYAVAQRTSEIGIRMALRANRLDVQRMVLRGASLQVGVGLLIGIPAAIAAGHLMAAELFGVSAWNPLVLGATTLVPAAVALLAAALPARRASGVEPMEALRGE